MCSACCIYIPVISLFSPSYQQAQSAVVIGLRKLEELEVPTTRPDDYFAEMVKTDDHMRKVCLPLTLVRDDIPEDHVCHCDR